MEFGDFVGDVADVSGLVALAAVRGGREVGRVGFHHDAVQWDRLDDVAEHRRVLERDYAGERQIKESLITKDSASSILAVQMVMLMEM